MSKGFTLIEILLVSSIISLLSSVVLTQSQDTRLKANDAHVQKEVREVGLAMEIRKGSTDSDLGTGEFSKNTVYFENSSEFSGAMTRLVNSGTYPRVPESPNKKDYFYFEEEGGDAVFGSLLRHEASINSNGGCFFSSLKYSCDQNSVAYNIFSRDILVTEADGCLSESDDCEGISLDNLNTSQNQNEIFWSSSSLYKLHFFAARQYCEDLDQDGYEDWRLPTVAELSSEIDNIDPSTQSYWTGDFSRQTNNPFTTFYYTVSSINGISDTRADASAICQSIYGPPCRKTVCTR
jgi:prepilin-type N-terminal cleavage/methylation domain-containing protein